MTTRRSFLTTGGALALGAAIEPRLAGATTPADRNRARGTDIVERIPALKEPWSAARSAKVFGSGDPGPTWPKAELISFSAAVDPDVAKAWLPPPLEPTDPAQGMIFVARYPTTKLGFGYNEAAAFVYGQYEGKEYSHCAWMVVDDDTALILGRDMLGFPKKMATIEANIYGDAPGGRVERKGLKVFEVWGSNVRPLEGVPSAMVNRPVVNVMGHVRNKPELLQLSGEQTPHWARAVDLEVSFGKSDLDPLYRLGMEPSQQGTAVIVDMGIGGAGGATEEKTLTGTPVPLAWMMEAYPFRVW